MLKLTRCQNPFQLSNVSVRHVVFLVSMDKPCLKSVTSFNNTLLYSDAGLELNSRALLALVMLNNEEIWKCVLACGNLYMPQGLHF